MSETGLSPGEFWVASGHLLCDRDGAGRVVPTKDLWRAFLARPELLPPEDACDAERALHARLMEAPLAAADPAALADASARENWRHFLAFRDAVARHDTLESAYVALFCDGVGNTPPIFLQMLTHLVLRAALDGEGDPFVLRAGEVFFRTQRVGIHQGSLLLADEETIEARAEDGGFGALGQLLVEAGAPPREVEFDVLGEANAHAYRGRSDAHDFALDIVKDSPGQIALGTAICRFLHHVLGETVTISPVETIQNWHWHVGLDAEATGIANDLWQGKKVKQERLARLIWLARLEFADDSRVLPRMKGRPVHLALAMDAAKRVRMKPQNLIAGLPLLAAGQAA